MLFHVNRRVGRDAGERAAVVGYWAEVGPLGHVGCPALADKRSWLYRSDVSYMTADFARRQTALGRIGPFRLRGHDWVPDGGLGAVPAETVAAFAAFYDPNRAEYVVGRQWARERDDFPDPPVREDGKPYVYDYLVAAPTYAAETSVDAERSAIETETGGRFVWLPARVASAYYQAVLRTTEPLVRFSRYLRVRYADLRELSEVYGALFAHSGYGHTVGRVDGRRVVEILARAHSVAVDPEWRDPEAGVARFLYDCGFPCSQHER